MTWNPWSTRTRKWKGPNKVRKGDTLVFKWRQKSNVIAQEDGMNPFAAYFYYKCSWDTADLTLHTVVSEPKSSGSVKFTIPKDAVGMHYFFYSNVGNSCKKGQKYETPIIF
ncbi:hypothetical protein CLOM_g13671 [Closterium sp. NIES-68]|nr:hypothetical protein CLOM_g24112 [Closterium sp. NIES-68]GJP54599.1 hypothetical protein CLOM_g13671 [Closterium sp. NIES-68]GJP59805.1 hypothetical protein CLOP_g15262 [Closterium sp. NIES-67]